MKKRLTQTLVDAADANPERDRYISDDGVTGFRLKITPAGRRILFFQYRAPDGRQRKLTFGDTSRISVEEARKLAKDAAAIAGRGKDPQDEADRRAEMPTLAAAFSVYDNHHVRPHLKTRTGDEYRRTFVVDVPQHLKVKKLSDVTRAHIAGLAREMRHRPAQANALLSMLHAFFSWCAGDGALSPSDWNPARGVKRYPVRKRSFVFEGDQLLRFRHALDEADNHLWPPAVGAMRLLLFSGMRKEEVLTLKWVEVELEYRRITLLDSKSGPRVVPLGKDAIAVLEAARVWQPIFDSAYVFPAPSDRSKPIRGFDKMWRRVRVAAGMPQLRVHDLRHNFGGMAAASTRSAVHVKGLLGHSQIGTTDRYMKLPASPLSDAADATNEAISLAMRPTKLHLVRGD